VLLGLFGILFLVAAFRPSLQPLAFLSGLITVVSFLLLAWLAGSYNHQIGRVFMADIVALVCLIIGGAAYIYAEYRQRS
jgi:nicotinamide riboside transporter PnuC